MDNLLRLPKILVPANGSKDDLAGSIFSLLMDSTIRRGDGLIFSRVQDDYKQKIAKFVRKQEPVRFVFQGLPFKCHNPVETLRQTPDLGELATLQRLMDINETIKQIYTPGVKYTILTEGRSYKNLFGATQSEVETYQSRCECFAKLVDQGNVIQQIDFLDLVGDKSKFLEDCKAQESLVSDEETEHFVPVMTRSLPIINNVAFEDLLAVFGYGRDAVNLTSFEKDFALYIHEAAKDLAIKYLAIQKVKKKLDVVASNFPDSLYVSTTTKQDRYSFHPIHKRTRLFAHHGVPVLGSDKVDIIYFAEIITNPEIYTAVYCQGDIEDAPFYFLKGKQHVKKPI